VKRPGIRFVASLAVMAALASRSAAQEQPALETPPGETPSPLDVEAEDGEVPDELSWPIGIKRSAELRGTRCYVAWGANRKGRLFRLSACSSQGR